MSPLAQPITERLYFADAYLRQFSARVVAHTTRHGHPAVALDQSAFYPEGGGQPADTGTLNGIAVADVQAEDGLVWHMLAAPLADERVWGEIDWLRRFDHMQQHHGQHLLSAACEQLYGLPTVSFHLGPASATIDLACEALQTSQISALEDLVNQVIWEDRPVLTRFVAPDELASISLRKPPTVAGVVRVVSVPEFDHSACGGTHPRTTGGVGLLHIRRCERRTATGSTAALVRVEFVCGGRASRDYRQRAAALSQIAATLSSNSDDAAMLVARLHHDEAQLRKQLALATSQLLSYEAQHLLASATGQPPVVRQLFAERPADHLRQLAVAIAAAGGVALLGSQAPKPHLIVAAGAGLSIDCRAVLAAALTPLGGRGGGQPTLAQGGLPDAALVVIALEQANRAVPHPTGG